MAADHLEATGHPHPCQGLGDHVLVHRGTEERLDGSQGAGRIVPLMGAMEREQQLAVAGTRGAEVDQAPTYRQSVGGAAELLPPDPDLGLSLIHISEPTRPY